MKDYTKTKMAIFFFFVINLINLSIHFFEPTSTEREVVQNVQIGFANGISTILIIIPLLLVLIALLLDVSDSDSAQE